jgi:hypothetical protein
VPSALPGNPQQQKTSGISIAPSAAESHRSTNS